MSFLKTGNVFLDHDGGLIESGFSTITYQTEKEKRFSLLYLIEPILEKNEHMVLFLTNETIDFLKQHVPFEKHAFLHFEPIGFISENQFIQDLSSYKLGHDISFVLFEETMDFQGRLRKLFNPDDSANYEIFSKLIRMLPVHAFFLHQVHIHPERIEQAPIMADLRKSRLTELSAYILSFHCNRMDAQHEIKFIKNRYGTNRQIAEKHQKVQ